MIKSKALFTALMLLFIFSSCKTVQTAQPPTDTPQDLSQYQGGMWIPSELKGKNEEEMHLLGSKLSADDIYNIQQASLKDAIVLFNGGCTAEVISNKGLLLTNHHCGYSAIQSHSTIEHDYLTDGFWAMNQEEELPNPDMSVTFIISMADVTEQMTLNTTGKSGKELRSQLKDNRKKLISSTPVEPWQEAEIIPFNKGNSYYLIISETYNDIRLVGAPPSSIGKFGADTDNWMWPRHSGDFSLFRIYAGKDNRPAAYSPDNQPYKPKKYLKVSLDGVREGDFTMVFGFPGRTDEYLPSVAIDQIINKLNPDKIALREASLAIMDKYMRSDEKTKIRYASKFAGIANYWKKWIGEMQGMIRTGAVEKKKKTEAEFLRRVHEKGMTKYENIFTEFDRLYARYGDIAQARDYWFEVMYRNIDLMRLAFGLYRLENLRQREGDEAFQQAVTKFKDDKEKFYQNFIPEIDREIFARLMYMYDAKYPKTKISEEGRKKLWEEKSHKIYSHSKLTTYQGLKELLQGTPEEIIRKLNEDPAYITGKSKAEIFFQQINPEYYNLKEQLDGLQKKYIKGLQELMPEIRMFPDANSTLRVTYGQVKGYEPRDGMEYLPVSYLQGVMEKYIPGDYEFDVSRKLQELYRDKNYGQYGENGKMPVNFIGTNHTTGGNSGSPVLDAYGNLIGLNFDRVWEGTMSDYYYDAAICRNIMVDIRYILFIIDKYAGAQRLIDELEFVHPKK
jgi:hypothetical protein